MLALSAFIAIAVVSAAFCIVFGVGGTLIWIRNRRKRRRYSSGKRGHGLQSFPEDTVTDLSQEEGSMLRQYGQLPYGRPTEWGVLESHESLVHSYDDSDTLSHRIEKGRSLRRSFSGPRRQSRLLRPHRISSLTAVTETIDRTPAARRGSVAKEDVSISAVDGILELPAETPPRHTPERKEQGIDVDGSTRPISGPGPSIYQSERSGGLFPVIEDRYEAFDPSRKRVRGGSIITQTPGAAPEQPVPPPPCAYPPNRLRLSKNDSLRFSSLSLETADSSIMNESRRASGGVESNFTSPALPPCPTFAPYSANDVGKIVALSYPPVPAPFVFPAGALVREAQRREPDRTSPRRSLTARSSTHSLERTSSPPRRSESLNVRQPRRESIPYTDVDRIAPSSVVGHNAALLPYFSQLQRQSVHGSQWRDHDAFYTTMPTLFGHPIAPGRSSVSPRPEIHLPLSNGHSKPPLASALKGGNGLRKGHRRQNCVRISIHPPITFGGPTFSPTAEEPEELEEFDMRRSRCSDPSKSNISSLRSSVSTFSAGGNGYPDHHRDGSLILGDNHPPSYRNSAYLIPTKKRKHSQDGSIDSIMNTANTNKHKVLPEIVTTFLPSMEGSLSHTPSPEKAVPVWIVPSYNGSPTPYDDIPSPSSPRRCAIKGPRIQPDKLGRNSNRSLPLDDSANSTSPSGRPRSQSMKHCLNRKSTDSLQRAKSAAANSPRPQSQYINDQEKQNRNSLLAAKQQGRLQPERPPPRSSSKAGNAHNRIVPIWEDQNRTLRSRSTRKSRISVISEEDGPAELHGESSPRRPERRKSRTRPEFTTPVKKTVGLGIGAATPGSLYDGDGFLKE
ncbi:hypothetical protein BDV28DRAFT_120599 [Aspergillus coremiiformis]|uniref:Uncharacterized protein n=1 Tax=Aspergillus coremiiformis TaxID=138285 RepID=A0A5N6Z6L2_9EURO|nr:hypothetical protein BDV28DRAFT_120599 [Aspergillus coremiiformis]